MIEERISCVKVFQKYPNSSTGVSHISTGRVARRNKFLGRTQYGHTLGIKTYHSAPEGTTTTKLQTTQHQQLIQILNRLADWKAALKRPASAVRSRLWPPPLHPVTSRSADLLSNRPLDLPATSTRTSAARGGNSPPRFPGHSVLQPVPLL
jgi:hypothetical protein